jgi:hypothetical protein
MSFQQLPWLVFSLFVAGEYDRGGDPGLGPSVFRGVVIALGILVVLVFSGLGILEVIRPPGAHPGPAPQGEINYLSTVAP